MKHTLWITNVHNSEINDDVIQNLLRTGHYLGEPFNSDYMFSIEELKSLGYQGIYCDIDVEEKDNEKKTQNYN